MPKIARTHNNYALPGSARAPWRRGASAAAPMPALPGGVGDAGLFNVFGAILPGFTNELSNAIGWHQQSFSSQNADKLAGWDP